MAQNDLPPPGASNFTQRVRETLMVALGRTGDPLDRHLTLRDLLDSGIAKVKSGFSIGSGMTGSLPLTLGQGEEPDLTPPPTPEGFAVSAAISHVFIEHAAPVYTVGHGHLRTRVYGVKYTGGALPTFSAAVELGQFSGTIWAMPSDPSTTWRLWIKWETNDGVLSVSPAGGTNGLVATTGQDVSLLLDALTGEIKESQLFSTLKSRINLIDGPDTLPGSVAARVKTEQAAREGADTAIAQQITTLSSQVNNATTGLPATRSLLINDYYTKANTDNAISSATTTLQSSVNNQLTGYATTAALQIESQARASQTGELFAKYTVKVDLNGYVSGFGLASTANNGVTVSDFAIRADRFYIANPSGPGIAPAMPFIVQTTPTTINGVNVPVGVYINDAFIRNGTIINAMIANLAVDNAKIANLSADKITAGTIAVGQHIQSSGYVPGSAGWRINGSGEAEFRNVTISGESVTTMDGFLANLSPQDITASQTLTGSFIFNMKRPGRAAIITRAIHSINAAFTTFDDYRSTVFNALLSQFIYVDGIMVGGFSNAPIFMCYHTATARTINLSAGDHTYTYNITYNGATSGAAWARPKPGFLDAVILKIYD